VTTPATIPEQVRAAREARGLTQAELAVASGVTQPMIADLEHRGANVTWATLARLAVVLGVPLVIDPEAPAPTVRLSERGKRYRARQREVFVKKE